MADEGLSDFLKDGAGTAGAGAAIGTGILPGVGTAIGAGAGFLVGGIGSLLAGNSAAKSAADIQRQQSEAAQRYGAQAQASAGPTALELANMHSQLQAAGAQLQRQAQMFASIDPTIMESSKQALSLMRGQNAGTIAPMLAQRAQQRSQLQQQLVQQLGPSGASSSAGMQALANFDMQTSTFQSQLQQGALGTLLGETNAGAQSAMSSGDQAAGIMSQAGQLAGGIQSRQTGAALSSGGMNVPLAGSSGLQGYLQAQNTGQLFGQLGKMGAYTGSAFNPKQPEQQPNTQPAQQPTPGGVYGSTGPNTSGYGGSNGLATQANFNNSMTTSRAPTGVPSVSW